MITAQDARKITDYMLAKAQEVNDAIEAAARQGLSFCWYRPDNRQDLYRLCGYLQNHGFTLELSNPKFIAGGSLKISW